MATPNSAVSDLIATTIESRSGHLADNLTNNVPLLKYLKKKGNQRPVSGGSVIYEEIMYNDSSTDTANSYSGYDAINISPDSPISAAQFDFKQYAASVTVNGLEILKNSGKEAIIDLLDSRIKIAEARLLNRIGSDLYLDGTGNGGKNITGLAAAVPDDPTTGTYGGINRATWSFWRPVKFSGSSDGGAAITSSNIVAYMTKLALSLVKDNEAPTLILADANYYSLYVNALQAIQRVTSEGSGESTGAGFSGVKFYGGGVSSDVLMCGGIGSPATANHMWFLNPNYIFWRPHKDRNFTPIGGERQAVNQDAIVKLMGWAGNMTMSGSRYQGVLIA